MRAHRTTARWVPLVVALAASLLTAAGPAVASHDGTGTHARASDDACPPGQVQPAHFFDVPDDGVHSPAVDCLVWYDVASGRSPLEYLPGDDVTRAQMARFVRALVERSGGQLPEPTRDHFSDDNGSLHEDSINRVAEARIVAGRGGDRFAPDGPVERGQMATFLVNAYQYRAQRALPPPNGDAFSDDDGTLHEDSTNRAAEAGFVAGTGPGRYTPHGLVRREQMASFLVRVLDLLVEEGRTTPPAPGAGDLDLAFGDRGTTAVPFGSDDPRDVPLDVLPLADGKTVVVARSSGNPGPTSIALARLDPEGSLDPTFGQDGRVTRTVSVVDGGYTYPTAAAVEPDGGILVAGFADGAEGQNDSFLVRFTPDGELDPTFGGDGVATTGSVVASALAPQPHGRVVLVGLGTSAERSDTDIAVLRLLRDGSPDLSFGTQGRTDTDVRGGRDVATDVVLQQDGRIVVAGGSTEPAEQDPTGLTYRPRATLLRYLPNGRLDTAFGDGGVVRADTGRGSGEHDAAGYDELSSVVVASDGSLVAGGLSQRDGDGFVSDTLLVRYDSAGAPDPAFDGDGVLLSAHAPSSRAVDLAVDGSGRIVTAGWGSQDDGSPYQFLVLARYAPDGRPDDSFGDAGVVRSGLGVAAAVAVTAAGIHVAGTDNEPFQSRAGRPTTVLISRFLAQDLLSR